MHAPLVGRTGLMGRALLATLALAPSVLTACGESAVAPPPQPPAPVASAVAPADSAPAPAPSASAAAYKDPTESDGPIRLTPLFGAAGSPPPTFPAATASDLGCLGRATVVGDNAKDYPAVVSACGAPTGLAEYTKPVSGMLQSAFDKQDSYVVALAAGYCYRVFATGDQSIFDLALSIAPSAGGKTTEDGARGSVAMLDNDRPLCVDQGGDYAINLAIEGMGYGGYTLGVWARPKQEADAGSPASASARPKKKK